MKKSIDFLLEMYTSIQDWTGQGQTQLFLRSKGLSPYNLSGVAQSVLREPEPKPEESANKRLRSGYTREQEKYIEMVESQTQNVPREKIIETLIEGNWDVVGAIMELS